jgi:hypothetical protein
MTARKKRSGYPFPLFSIGQEKCPILKELHYKRSSLNSAEKKNIVK